MTPYCDTINPRTSSGDFAAVALVANGFNYARQVTEGMDLDLTYESQFRNGQQLSARLLATHIFELTNYLDPENPGFADRVLGELGYPEFAFNLDLGYVIGDLAWAMACVTSTDRPSASTRNSTRSTATRPRTLTSTRGSDTRRRPYTRSGASTQSARNWRCSAASTT